MKYAVFCFCFFSICAQVVSSGASAESSSADRGEYLAEKGRVIPSEEVSIYSYVAGIDYSYPDPDGPLGVNILLGNSHYSMHGQEAVVQIGLQGRRIPYSRVAPMNLAYVVDMSGSMSVPEKVGYSRIGLENLLSRLRATDTLSVIVYSDKATVLLPPTPIPNIDKAFVLQLLDDSLPFGEADHASALRAGRDQILGAMKRGSVNRIILLSDCLGAPQTLPELAEQIGQQGVSITAVGVGEKADMKTINALGKNSGGSSRFLQNVDKVEETFGPDLDRMLVPSAVDLEMEIEFMPGARITGTWGYDAEVEGNRATYTHHTLHNQDYETIMVRALLPAVPVAGTRDIGVFTISYNDVGGKRVGPERYTISTVFTDSEPGLIGLSHPTVLQANTVLRAALSLKQIGVLNESIPLDHAGIYELNTIGWTNRQVTPDEVKAEVINEERREHQNATRFKQQRCIDLSLEMRKEIRYIRMLLGVDVLESEKNIFDSYVDLFSRAISLNEMEIAGLLGSPSLRPMGDATMLAGRLACIVNELMVPMVAEDAQTVMFSGFQEADEERSQFGQHVSEVVKSGFSGMRILSPSKDYMDVITAAVEKQTDFAISGSIIVMDTSVAVIAKALKMPESELAAVAYSVIPMSPVIETMLRAK